MFGFLIGWGVFWALIWGSMLAVWWTNPNINAVSAIGTAVSVIYLIAVYVGKIEHGLE